MSYISNERSNWSCVHFFFLLLVVFLQGCSSFNRDWEVQGAQSEMALQETLVEQSVSTEGLEGHWEGTWRSEDNGHEGGLRCIITRNEEDTLIARYHATYGMFFTFEYKMPMEVVKEKEFYLFSAETDLGWLAGGLYKYEGTVIGDDFASTYKCKRDHGIFEMKRVD